MDFLAFAAQCYSPTAIIFCEYFVDISGMSLALAVVEKEVDAMTTDERDILELLKEELDFIEKGGYGRSVRTPWHSKSTFQDSLSCINYGYPSCAHPCNECHLLDFVSLEHRAEEVPCNFIPLNTDGETINDLEMQDNQAKLEREVSEWLRARIKQIEEERTEHANV